MMKLKLAIATVAATLFAFSAGPISAQTVLTTTKPVAPIQLKPTSNAPITMHMLDESKTIYLAIGKVAGLTVLFDPDYTSRRVQVDFTDASLKDALRIVAELTGTFYAPLTSDTIFVAQNTPAKHNSLDDRDVQTFFLNNVYQASDLNEVNTTVRNILPSDEKIFTLPQQNAMVVRATPENLVLVQKLINDLDRPKKTYRLTYTVTESDNGKRVGTQHFAMVLVSGQTATLKQGSKVPIATGSYSATATAGDSPSPHPAGVQTQFTYLDVGMNFEATLTEMGNNAMLKSKVEQSSIAPEQSGVGPQDPIVRQTSLQGMFLLSPGKPLILGSVDIPGSTRHLDVEAMLEPLP